MKFKLINESGAKTYAIIFDKDDEVIANLQKFATQQSMKPAKRDRKSQKMSLEDLLIINK